MNRATEDHKIWLFDLAHGNLTELEIVKGFIKFYDLVFRTHYNPVQGVKALKVALSNFSEVDE